MDGDATPPQATNGERDVSMLNGITGAAGFRPAGSEQLPVLGAVQQPGEPSAARQLTSRFGGVFHSTFSSTMATVYERGISGEFDDPTLRLQEQAALARLRIAQAAASQIPAPVIGGGNAGEPAEPVASDGANAAPAPTPGAPDAAITTLAIAEERELHAVRVRQSEARLANVSRSLAQDFPKAGQLASASTGTWDPATFEPRTRDEVEAFAQRMVIDATEAAARLEIVMTQLDAARFEARHGGGPEAAKLVAELEAASARQKLYVDKLATIVDEQSGGQVQEAGQDALDGRTLRGPGDMSVGELAADLRASGLDEEQVRRLVGAGELVIEQDQTPGGSPRLKQIVGDMTATMLARFNRIREEHREERQRQELERAVEDRRDKRRMQVRRQDERAVAKGLEQRAIQQQALDQRAAQHAAAFEQWMATLAAARAAEGRANAS